MGQVDSYGVSPALPAGILIDKIESGILKEKSREEQRIAKIRRQKRKRSKRAKDKMLADKKKQSAKKQARGFKPGPDDLA